MWRWEHHLLVCLLSSTIMVGSARAESIEDTSGQALASFRASIERVRQGSPTLSRVVQFGDSHTANDLWTGALRRGLQARFGDGGHGFVIPGRPWAQYRHLDVGHAYNDRYWKVSRLRPATPTPVPFGLGGVVLDARQDGARLRVLTSRRGEVGRAVSMFDLFFQVQPGGGSIRARIDGKLIVTMSTDMEKAAPAFRRFEVPDGSHHLELDAVGRGPVRIYGVVLERRGPGVVVDSVGVPGLRAENLLMSEGALLKAHLVRRNPDLIILAFGAVEANHPGFEAAGYAETVARVVEHVKIGAPAASCLILGPIDRARRIKGGGWESLPTLPAITAAQREAAKSAGCAFWDTRAAMGGEGSILRWYEEGLTLRDRIHLNRRGYTKLAGLLEAALVEAVGE